VQPCFDQEVVSRLSDQATTNRLELEAWGEGERVHFDAASGDQHIIHGQVIGTEDSESDNQLLQAANTGNLSLLEEWTKRLQNSPDARSRLTRTFLSAIAHAPIASLRLLINTGMVDVHAEDEINERNCLHEATINGRADVLEVGLSRGVNVARKDVYGRIPLHYACMHGQVAIIQSLLISGQSTVDDLDHDKFTPLIHGIVHHRLECVQQLLQAGARIEPEGESDHIPLNLACQYDNKEIVQMLLERRAQILPDAEGLYPQHLVARSGQTPDILLLLEAYGVDLNQKDKLYQWTPLFHAASEGMFENIRVLLDKGVETDVLDEKGLPAMYYAAWEGHLANASTSLRNTSSARSSHSSSTIPQAMALEPDSIPELELPPPIIPLRRYGHNFLDTKAFISLSFEGPGADSILFYHDSKYPAARLTISSKSSDLIPRNVVLPMQEETRVISFQVDSLDQFSVDFDIYPTFGAKVIARTVALPSVFSAQSSSSGMCCLPLFDPRLRAIGQISFRFQVIKPFPGIPLEIAQFETYWKATTSKKLGGASMSGSQHQDTMITGSSLSGEYVQLYVQLTADGVPILYPRWTMNHHGLQFPVGRLTSQEFASLAPPGNTRALLDSLSSSTNADVASIHATLSHAYVTLADVLAHMPTQINVALQVLYPDTSEEKALGLGPGLNINDYGDAILKDVFEHARHTRQPATGAAQNGTNHVLRSIVFLSWNANICTAINWKQPNCTWMV